MSHPTPEAVQKIQDYVNVNITGSFSNSDIYLAGRLNDVTYEINPEPPALVYSNFAAPSLFSALSASSVKNVLASPGTAIALLPLLNALPHDSQSVALINVWGQAYEAAGIITPVEYASVTGIIYAQVNDPAWVSGVSWAQLNIGRSVDLDDIQACR